MAIWKQVAIFFSADETWLENILGVYNWLLAPINLRSSLLKQPAIDT